MLSSSQFVSGVITVMTRPWHCLKIKIHLKMNLYIIFFSYTMPHSYTHGQQCYECDA